tara:strand:- start:29719 stop:32835 length:3117 start_codon:yes stop_codon:yes gene_type:complete
MATDKLILQLQAKGVNLTKGQLKQLNKAVDENAVSTQKATAAFAAMAVGAYALGKALSSAIKTGMEFNSTMAEVQAISRANEEQFNALRSSAREFGVVSVFTASQVGELQVSLTKLGFTIPEIQNVTKGILDLAAATGSELADSASVAGETLRGFQLESTEMGELVNVMGRSFVSSALDLTKFSESMKYVAPIAKEAGFSVSDTSAVLGVLANNAISGSMAGTSLRKIFLEMGNASSKLAQRIGFPIRSMEDLKKGMGILKSQGFDPLTDGADLVGQRAVTAFSIMYNQIGNIEKLNDTLGDTNLQISDMAEDKLDNLAGDLVKQKAAFDNLSITISDSFDPALRGATKLLTSFINQLDPEEVKAYTTAIGLSAIGIGIYNKQQIAAYYATIKTTWAVKGMRAALISTGWGAIAVALGLVVGALLDYFNVFDDNSKVQDDYNKGLDDSIKKTKELKDVTQDSLSNVEVPTYALEFDKSTLVKRVKEVNSDLIDVNKDYANKIIEADKAIEDTKVMSTYRIDSIMVDSSKKYTAAQIEAMHWTNLQVESLKDVTFGQDAVYYGAKLVNGTYVKTNMLTQGSIDLLKSRKTMTQDVKDEQSQIVFNLEKELENLEKQLDISSLIREGVREQLFSAESMAKHYTTMVSQEEAKSAKMALNIQYQLFQNDLLTDLTDEQLVSIQNMIKEGKTKAEILDLYGDEEALVNNISEARQRAALLETKNAEKNLFKTILKSENEDEFMKKVIDNGKVAFKNIEQFSNDEVALIAEKMDAGLEYAQAVKEALAESRGLTIVTQDDVDKDKEMFEAQFEQIQDHVNQIGDLMSSFASANIAKAKEEAQAKIDEINRVESEELESLRNSVAYKYMTDAQKITAEKKITEANDKLREKEKNSANKKIKENFKIQQAAKIASIAMSTADAVMKAMAGSIFSAGLPWTAIAVAMGAAQTALVLGQKAPTMRQGGLIGGLEHEAGGTPIIAEQGEFIMNRQAVDDLGVEALDRMNQGGLGSPNITFSGNILSDQFLEEEAVPKIKEILRQGGSI